MNIVVMKTTKVHWSVPKHLILQNVNICHPNDTVNPQLNAFDYSSTFTFFKDIQKQRLLGTKQPPFRVTKFNTFQYVAFAWITNSQLKLTSTIKEKTLCWVKCENIIEKKQMVLDSQRN